MGHKLPRFQSPQENLQQDALCRENLLVFSGDNTVAAFPVGSRRARRTSSPTALRFLPGVAAIGCEPRLAGELVQRAEMTGIYGAGHWQPVEKEFRHLPLRQIAAGNRRLYAINDGFELAFNEVRRCINFFNRLPALRALKNGRQVYRFPARGETQHGEPGPDTGIIFLAHADQEKTQHLYRFRYI